MSETAKAYTPEESRRIAVLLQGSDHGVVSPGDEKRLSEILSESDPPDPSGDVDKSRPSVAVETATRHQGSTTIEDLSSRDKVYVLVTQMQGFNPSEFNQVDFYNALTNAIDWLKEQNDAGQVKQKLALAKVKGAQLVASVATLEKKYYSQSGEDQAYQGADGVVLAPDSEQGQPSLVDLIDRLGSIRGELVLVPMVTRLDTIINTLDKARKTTDSKIRAELIQEIDSANQKSGNTIDADVIDAINNASQATDITAFNNHITCARGKIGALPLDKVNKASLLNRLDGMEKVSSTNSWYAPTFFAQKTGDCPGSACSPLLNVKGVSSDGKPSSSKSFKADSDVFKFMEMIKNLLLTSAPVRGLLLIIDLLTNAFGCAGSTAQTPAPSL